MAGPTSATFVTLDGDRGWKLPSSDRLPPAYHAAGVDLGQTGMCLATAPGGPLDVPSVSGDPAARALLWRQAGVSGMGFAGESVYQRAGTWRSGALDSGIHRCHWHRIELELGALPPQTSVKVYTFSAATREEVEPEIDKWPVERWEENHAAHGQMQPPPGVSQYPIGPSAGHPDKSSGRPYGGDEGLHHEFLVQSREGQFLWLRVDLSGPGHTSPVVRSLRVHFPRESYLDYLPAVYSADDESRWFLERFLAVFQTEWDNIEARIVDFARLVDPRTVPEGPWLKHLASWLALQLEDDWSGAQQRRLLCAAPQYYPRRGTPAAMAALLRAVFDNGRTIDEGNLAYARRSSPHCSSAPLTEQDASRAVGFPILVEGFRVRDQFLATLGQPCDADFKPTRQLGEPRRLWGESEDRLRVGGEARLGGGRLRSLALPTGGLLEAHANRFQVYVPATWVRTVREERMVRNAVEAEKPAHTAYGLQLVGARLQVERQSTVGLDTIVAAYPRTRLLCAAQEPTDDDPPASAPRQRLGLDTILGSGFANWHLQATRAGGQALAPGLTIES